MCSCCHSICSHANSRGRCSCPDVRRCRSVFLLLQQNAYPNNQLIFVCHVCRHCILRFKLSIENVTCLFNRKQLVIHFSYSSWQILDQFSADSQNKRPPKWEMLTFCFEWEVSARLGDRTASFFPDGALPRRRYPPALLSHAAVSRVLCLPAGLLRERPRSRHRLPRGRPQ